MLHLGRTDVKSKPYDNLAVQSPGLGRGKEGESVFKLEDTTSDHETSEW